MAPIDPAADIAVPPIKSGTTSPPARNIHEFCLRVLNSGDLESKLTAPTDDAGHRLPDTPRGPAVFIDRPTRCPDLRMTAGSERLPRPGLLGDPDHRIRCLARFAHHELMAVELFAWALLRWPSLPDALRRGLLSALVDEQRHCRLYLARLDYHGGNFESDDHSDYFWQQARTIAASAAGPRAFLAAIGLTLEQANLDFTLTYRDGFAAAGDEASAAVCQLVHDEEITHVALAARWMGRLDDSGEEDVNGDSGTDLDRYLAAVPFPLGPARAKGRRFEVAPRRRAGLSEEMIEFIRLARSTQERGVDDRRSVDTSEE
jgi:uncharacterized ferritin-like protein (DUF455 family)